MVVVVCAAGCVPAAVSSDVCRLLCARCCVPVVVVPALGWLVVVVVVGAWVINCPTDIRPIEV